MQIYIGKEFIGYVASALFALGAFFSVYNGFNLESKEQAFTLAIAAFGALGVYFNKRLISYVALALMIFQTGMVVYGFYEFKQNAAVLFGLLGGEKNPLISLFINTAISEVTLELGFFSMLIGTLVFGFHIVRNNNAKNAQENKHEQHAITELLSKEQNDQSTIINKSSDEVNLKDHVNHHTELLSIKTHDQNNSNRHSNTKIIALTATIALIVGAGFMYLYHYTDSKNQKPTDNQQANNDTTDFDDAVRDYEGQKYESALKKFELLANRGNANAQTWLGFMYDNGEGVAQNKSEAVAWYRKAADQGYAAAQNNLALMYDNGEGVAQNKSEAVAWYRKAADQGYAAAQYNLGFMYDNGEGVAQNKSEAVAWYRKAADQGYADAQYNLGAMYEKGYGIEKDHAQAVAWYRKAADQGHTDAKRNLDRIYKNGDFEKKDLNSNAKTTRQERSNTQPGLTDLFSDQQKNKKTDRESEGKSANAALVKQETSTWISAIGAKVRRAWIKESTENAVCDVYMRQTLEGEVKEVRVKSCQGEASEAYKRSVELAVRRASPLPRAPSDEVFKEEIVFTFKPQ